MVKHEPELHRAVCEIPLKLRGHRWSSDVPHRARNAALTRAGTCAPRGNRTPNPLIKSQLLCQLS